MRKISYYNNDHFLNMFINENGDLFLYAGDEDADGTFTGYIELDKEDVLSLIKDLQDVVKDMS